MSTETMYRHELLLSPDEHSALESALAHTLMSFYDTAKIRKIFSEEQVRLKATKVLYNRITGLSADSLLQTYQEILDNPPTGDEECPF